MRHRPGKSLHSQSTGVPSLGPALPSPGAHTCDLEARVLLAQPRVPQPSQRKHEGQSAELTREHLPFQAVKKQSRGA